jgi:hypothetical protein
VPFYTGNREEAIMEKYKWEDTVITIRDVYSGIDDFTLPAFSLGSVVWQVPDTSIVLVDFDEEGIRTMARKNIAKIQAIQPA